MYRRILVPIDGSAASERGLDEAMRLAREREVDLQLVHVVDLHAFTGATADGAAALGESTLRVLHDAGRALLDRAQARLQAEGLQAGTRMVDSLAGAVAPAIVEASRAFRADLIVLGTHGRRGVRRMILGSDAAAVSTLADVPVMLVRGPEDPAGD